MKNFLHKADSRGFANHGWLISYHSFSFASYHNPEKMGFGTLRVINDDSIAPKMGFDTHPHKNMEIVSIPLKGVLRHKDTMGNDFVIKKGEVQVMSAGRGVAHSEFNDSSKESVELLQIWVLPKERNIDPGYFQRKFEEKDRLNQFQLIVSPDGEKGSLSINQKSYFSLINLSEMKEAIYQKYNKANGIYFFVIDGLLEIHNTELNRRDALGIIEEDFINILNREDRPSELLVIEVPMS